MKEGKKHGNKKVTNRMKKGWINVWSNLAKKKKKKMGNFFKGKKDIGVKMLNNEGRERR